MRTEYKHNPPIPYSLHDMRVKKIIIQDKTIVLEFEDGYEKLTEPFEQVEGNITIEVLQTKVNRKNEKSPAKFTRPKMGITKQAGEKSHRQPG